MILLALACAEPELESASFYAMSTRIDVTVVGDVDRALPTIESTFRDVEARCNEWRADSPIGLLNRDGRAYVDDDTGELLARSKLLAEQTGGAFDPTWASLWSIWNFSRPILPTDEAVQEAVQRIDHTQLVLDGPRVMLAPGMQVGLGGVAKGWALDHAAERLEAAGYRDFTLSAGGQVVARGQTRGRAWRVGVRDPRGGPEEWLEIVDLVGSISTSGDYERYIDVRGERYHHVLDPRTGWPTEGVASSSVMAPDAVDADALSTAVMVLGPVDGLAVIEGLEGVEALVITTEGDRVASSGWD